MATAVWYGGVCQLPSPSIYPRHRVRVQLDHRARLAAVVLHALPFTHLIMNTCRRPSASPAAQRPEGSAVTQRRDTTTRSVRFSDLVTE